MWQFDNIWNYWNFVDTFSGLASTGTYYQWIVDSVQPTINFMYNNFLTNPIIIWLIAVLLVLSLFTFSD